MKAKRSRLAILAALLCCAGSAVAAPRVVIPDTSIQYRFALRSAVVSDFGVDAPLARVAAQIQQESGWNPKARSSVAAGLAQFIPSTARWLPSVCPGIGAPDPWDADWSVRAVSCYDAYLYARATGVTQCDRWAMTLSAYNGGEGARDKERAAAARAGVNSGVWFDAVEKFRARGAAAYRENRGYVTRILTVLEPAYVDAGWPGEVACHVG